MSLCATRPTSTNYTTATNREFPLSVTSQLTSMFLFRVEGICSKFIHEQSAPYILYSLVYSHLPKRGGRKHSAMVIKVVITPENKLMLFNAVVQKSCFAEPIGITKWNCRSAKYVLFYCFVVK